MSIQSIQHLKVSDLITNLTAISLDVNSQLSNAQKSAERVEWFKLAIQENRLTDFLTIVEETINSLPEGTEEIATIHPVTGKKGVKKINQRDIAKAAYKTAWGHARKETDYSGKDLAFKLSIPTLADKKAPATTEDKIAKLLGDSIDKKGLETIMFTIIEEQARHKEEVAKLATYHKARTIAATLANDIAYAMRRDGMTIDKAQAIAAAMNDMTVEELQQAIG